MLFFAFGTKLKIKIGGKQKIKLSERAGEKTFCRRFSLPN